MRRKLFWQVSLMMAVIIGTFFSCSDGSFSGGVVDSFIGDVFINGTRAKTGQAVLPGSAIKTGPYARLDITFDGKNIIEIFDQADVVLDLKGLNKKVILNSGTIGHVLKNLGKMTNNSYVFEVETVAAVLSVRGTVFCVSQEGHSVTYACACNGTIDLKDKKGGNDKRVTAAHHQAFRYVLNQGKVSVKPAGLDHHSDTTIEALAARIGYKIDWTKPD